MHEKIATKDKQNKRKVEMASRNQALPNETTCHTRMHTKNIGQN